ncbi:Cytochrome c6 [Symbiodinium microadriaticum]|uniref:Cytochrome c-553 n=1 Tax=Symbiodinium microadriaticum TaxID=2951 RepID=A0A1Q9ENE1_SYMMI|nr:Cytochrome c6 [Symbiodinium microadriaticum]
MAFDDFDYEENPVEDASMSRVSYVAEPPTDPSRIRNAGREVDADGTNSLVSQYNTNCMRTGWFNQSIFVAKRTAPIDRGIPFACTAAFSTVAMAKLSTSGTGRAGRKVLALMALLFAPLCFTAGPASRGRTARAASAEAADGPSEEAIKTRSIFMSLDSDEFGIDMDEVEKSGIPTDETEPDDLQQVGDFVSGPFILPFVTAIVEAKKSLKLRGAPEEAENAFYYSAVNQVAAVKSDEPGFDFRALKPDVVEEITEAMKEEDAKNAAATPDAAVAMMADGLSARRIDCGGAEEKWPPGIKCMRFDRLVREKLEGGFPPRLAMALDAVMGGGAAVWEAQQRREHLAGWQLFLCSACVGLAMAPTVRAADLVNGEAVFDANCVSCHAGGGNKIYPQQTLSRSALERNGKYSVELIAQQVSNGQTPMPAFKAKLTEKSIEDVASFVYAEAEVNWKDKKLVGGSARRFSQFLDSLWPFQ